MHRPQFFTWTTHTAEATTLLEATRLQKLYTYMCNIVTEFYLYSIVYIYLINSRLDVTHSVRHHFRTIQTLSDSRMELIQKDDGQTFIMPVSDKDRSKSITSLRQFNKAFLIYSGIYVKANPDRSNEIL